MDVKITDNSKEFLAEFEKAMIKALTEIGLTAEGYAKKAISEAPVKPAVVTGRLRNSITFAISGQAPNISSYQGDHGESGTPYSGTAPEGGGHDVYIGTNVVYAEGIETGTHRNAGAVHFLRNAATQHGDEYKQLIMDELKG